MNHAAVEPATVLTTKPHEGAPSIPRSLDPSIPSADSIGRVHVAEPSFSDLVRAELAAARCAYPSMRRHLEAAGILREKYEDYWLDVRERAERRNAMIELDAIVQLAAMAQRASEDLLPENLERRGHPFSYLVALQIEELRTCLHCPLTTSHAAATWLRFSVRKFEDLVEMGREKTGTAVRLDVLIGLAAKCHVVAADLHLLDRAAQRRRDEAEKKATAEAAEHAEDKCSKVQSRIAAALALIDEASEINACETNHVHLGLAIARGHLRRAIHAAEIDHGRIPPASSSAPSASSAVNPGSRRRLVQFVFDDRSCRSLTELQEEGHEFTEVIVRSKDGPERVMFIPKLFDVEAAGH